MIALKTLFTKIRSFFSSLSNAHDAKIFSDDAAITTNPYISARREWNFMFGDIIKAKQNWQYIAFTALLINIILVIGFIALSLQHKTVAYAVKVDNLGDASFAGFLNKEAIINPAEINAFIRRYITDAREVIADPIAQKQNLSFVYLASGSTATNYLNDYYRENNPFALDSKLTVEVTVNAVLQRSENTWQVDWTENTRNLNGDIMDISHWEALVNVTHQDVKDSDLININPLGIFINQLSWTRTA